MAGSEPIHEARKLMISAAVAEAFAYARDYYRGDQEVIDDFELLADYLPAAFVGYITLRQSAFNTGPSAALSSRMKELVILAIEFGRTKVNEPPVGHARWAIAAGASAQDVVETAALAVAVGGMLTYRESALEAIRAVAEQPEGGDASG